MQCIVREGEGLQPFFFFNNSTPLACLKELFGLVFISSWSQAPEEGFLVALGRAEPSELPWPAPEACCPGSRSGGQML